MHNKVPKEHEKAFFTSFSQASKGTIALMFFFPKYGKQLDCFCTCMVFHIFVKSNLTFKSH